MQKAGNYDLPYEIAQEDDDFLFAKEVNAVQSLQNKSEAAGFKSSFMQNDIPTKRGDARKDFIQVAFGDDRSDNVDFKSDESESNINEDMPLNTDAEEDFAYLKHQIE